MNKRAFRISLQVSLMELRAVFQSECSQKQRPEEYSCKLASSLTVFLANLSRLVAFCPLALYGYPVLWHNVIPQMHCSGLAWHPDVATQMVLASEDDRLPVIQMWDLRFTSSPLRVLESHTRYMTPAICCSVMFTLLMTIAVSTSHFLCSFL